MQIELKIGHSQIQTAVSGAQDAVISNEVRDL